MFSLGTVIRFQSHAGSIEALIVVGVEHKRKIVSIPRWFD